jgi:hypothetical protein
MRQYSIAVAPDSSLAKRLSSCIGKSFVCSPDEQQYPTPP